MWVHPIENKQADTTVDALYSIFKRMESLPNNVKIMNEITL